MPTKDLLFVVDTDIPHRDMMAGWLQDQGYRVKVFDNGELCLNTLDENPGPAFPATPTPVQQPIPRSVPSPETHQHSTKLRNGRSWKR